MARSTVQSMYHMYVAEASESQDSEKGSTASCTLFSIATASKFLGRNDRKRVWCLWNGGTPDLLHVFWKDKYTHVWVRPRSRKTWPSGGDSWIRHIYVYFLGNMLGDLKVLRSKTARSRGRKTGPRSCPTLMILPLMFSRKCLHPPGATSYFLRWFHQYMNSFAYSLIRGVWNLHTANPPR